MATFPAASRLHHKPQFDAVYRHGKRVGDLYFLVLAKSNDGSIPRLGLSISTKNTGNSVNRNRVKRIIRESFRQHQHLLPPLDIVVNSRQAARTAVNSTLRMSLEKHWLEIARKCAR